MMPSVKFSLMRMATCGDGDPDHAQDETRQDVGRAAVAEDGMPVREGADGNLDGRKQVREDGEEREEGLGDFEVEDHDAVERAVDGHERHGDGGVDEGELEAFEEH
jgi:hypothetical protein